MSIWEELKRFSVPSAPPSNKDRQYLYFCLAMDTPDFGVFMIAMEGKRSISCRIKYVSVRAGIDYHENFHVGKIQALVLAGLVEDVKTRMEAKSSCLDEKKLFLMYNFMGARGSLISQINYNNNGNSEETAKRVFVHRVLGTIKNNIKHTGLLHVIAHLQSYCE